LKKEKNMRRKRTANESHGDSKTRIYRIWHGMVMRTQASEYKDYDNYGARGIGMCQEWQDSFIAFRDWAYSNGYDETLTIERKDNNADYSPDNCIWADKITQENNKTNTRWVTFMGRTQSLFDWAREMNLPYRRLAKRYRLGWPDERILDPCVYKNQYA
jgi:hypothetical protein